MKKESYHHGDLKKMLIFEGLDIVKNKGIDGLTLRKVALQCGVSHNAPYKHFKDKNELMTAMVDQVFAQFRESLIRASNKHKSSEEKLLRVGLEYIRFMTENPHFLKLMFLSDNSLSIKITDNGFEDIKSTAFEVFKDIADSYFIDKNVMGSTDKVLGMWSMIHGLAILITEGSISFDKEWTSVAEPIIKEFIT